MRKNDSSVHLHLSPSPKFNFKALVAGLVVVIGGGIAVWVMTRDDGVKGESVKGEIAGVSRIAEVAPQIATITAEVAAAVPTNRAVRMENGVEVVKSQMTTNTNGAVIERLWLADGTTKRKIRPPKPLFENAADQLIAMAVSAKPGQSMPPLPDLSSVDDDFAKALLTPIRIADGDSEEVKEMKAKVMEARAYLTDEVKNGGTVREALRKYQVDMERYADSHAMAAQQLQEIRKEDGDEAEEEFRNRINESFRARGIPELELPNKRNDKTIDAAKRE